MLKLRELTMEHHKNAERSNFAKKLISGKILRSEYAAYLCNMWRVYNCLEMCAVKYNLFEGIGTIKRAKFIKMDYLDIVGLKKELTDHVYTCSSTLEYIDYLSSLEDPEKLLAHIYVRHMGDLSGGQIIAKKLRGKFPIKFYMFSEDTEVLKEKLREKLNNDMADEAMVAFDYAHKIFLELDMLFNDNSKPEGHSDTSE